MEQNPVEVPVRSVNGQTGGVKLTAEDVGAISQDDLQEATNEALAQAKASGDFDGPQGPAGPKGEKGDPGDDYVLTEADKEEIAEMAAELVDVPDSGGNVDLTGYATEKYVREYAQPKGDYLTEVPEGYAKTEDIPTKPEDIGAQPAGNYLTEVPSGYATEEFVKNKIAEAELGGEEVDLSGYAQKSELPTKVSELENDAGYLTEHQDLSDYAKKTELPVVPVQSVNGKTGTVKLSASDVGARPNTWMPTAQDVGALPSTYTPPNQTAEQVGADPKGTAQIVVGKHNVDTDSHNDIRLELKEMSDRLTSFFDSDDTTLDELSEIVAYITNNKVLIDSITTSKVSVADIINNLTTNVSNKPLSAAQGVVLKGLIDTLSNSLSGYQPKGDYALRSEIPSVPVQSVNGQTGEVKLTAGDVGAISQDDLQEATSEALAQAKASGEFDGPQGPKGDPGEPGADGADYILTDADKTEIAEMAAELVEIPDSSQNVEIDTTLTQSGKAADAKAVGDKLTELNQAKANNDDLAAVAKSGSYADLTGKPTIPTVPDALKNPNKLILSGAVTAEYDGSEPVTVNIPSLAVDDSLTQSGQAADSAKVGEELRSLSDEIANLPDGGSSLTAAQINALDGMFKVAAYDDSKDVSGAYAAFKAAFGLVDSGVTTYTITAELVNVTSSNSATSITEGESYTATLTAADGYELSTVSVLMGGVDVTADVYADGVISIPAVNGNVEIIARAAIIEDVGASLPESGLVDFFDMRNATGIEESGKLAIYATNGNGNLFTWSTTALTESNEYGAKLANRDWTLVTSETLGKERTVIFMSYNGCVSYRNMLNQKSTNIMSCTPMYTNSGGTTVSGTSSDINFTPFGNNYLYPVVRCNADTLSLFTDNQKLTEYNAANFEGFGKWVFPPVRPKDTNPYLTAIAIYNRALSDSEIVDVVEYLKTLEVTA